VNLLHLNEISRDLVRILDPGEIFSLIHCNCSLNHNTGYVCNFEKSLLQGRLLLG